MYPATYENSSFSQFYLGHLDTDMFDLVRQLQYILHGSYSNFTIVTLHGSYSNFTIVTLHSSCILHGSIHRILAIAIVS